MKRTLGLAVVVILASTSAWAQFVPGQPLPPGSNCNPGDPEPPCTGPFGMGVRRCLLDSGGFKGGFRGVCYPAPVGGLTPKYFVLSVVYPPPGKSGGGSQSNVTYEEGSSAGTTTSAENSFNKDHSVTASLGFNIGGKKDDKGDTKGGVSGEIGGGFTYALSSTDTKSLEISKEKSFSLSGPGPDSDGIDHDGDIFVLWLAPRINVQASSASAAWSIDDGGTKVIQFVSVRELRGELRNPGKVMDAGLRATLAGFGITPDEYPKILERDPFYMGEPTSGPFGGLFKPFFNELPFYKPERFLRTGYSLPYKKEANGCGLIPTLSISTGKITTDGQSDHESYKVNLFASAGIGFGPVKASLKTDNNWEWTNTATFNKNQGTKQSAAVSIGCASNAYDSEAHGANAVVYYDQIYKTFAFVLTNKPEILVGIVSTPGGRPAVGQEVTAKAGDTVLTTYTDSQGRYAFVDALDGPVELRSGSIVKSIGQADLMQRMDLAPD